MHPALKQFLFPKITPASIPIMAIQKGIVGGRERENIRQVTNMAEVIGLPCLTVKRASAPIPNADTTTMRIRERHPNKYIDAITGGMSAYTTLSIAFCIKKIFFSAIFLRRK